jgi:hypothetical protein
MQAILKKVEALRGDVYTVTTRLMLEDSNRLIRYDAEPLIAKVVNDSPRFDPTLHVWFGVGVKRALAEIDPVCYSLDQVIAGRACLLRYEVKKESGERESMAKRVSIRRPDESIIEAEGAYSLKPMRGDSLYFHPRDLRLMLLEPGRCVLVSTDPVFESDQLRVDFRLMRRH